MLILKMCRQLKDFGSTTDIFQWILSDFLTLHHWPKGPTGKKVGLLMTFLTFLLFASPGLFLHASPEPTTRWTRENANNTEYLKWASETGRRLQVASYFLVMVGSVELVLAIFIILFEDQWVANIVSKFNNHAKQENDGNEELAAAEAKIERRVSDTEVIESNESDVV